MEQKQFEYTRKIGKTTYSVIVTQTEGATERISNKIKKLLLNDLSNAG